MSKAGKYLSITLVIILIDQISKLLVFYYMGPEPGMEINVIGEWFRLHYLLNPGMAFGIELGLPYGKVFLTLFRIFATIGIGIFLYSMAKNDKGRPGFLVCLALILGGAIGNAIDSIFYGVFLPGNVIWDAPTPWFHGRVIDMLFFPLYTFHIPEFIPSFGGESFLFFSPVFNIADSSIFVGVAITLIFQKKFFVEEETKVPKNETASPDLAAQPKGQSTSDDSSGHSASGDQDSSIPKPSSDGQNTIPTNGYTS